MELHIRQLYKNQVINIAIYPYLIPAKLYFNFKNINASLCIFHTNVKKD